MSLSTRSYILRVDAPDRAGLVAAVSGALFSHGFNIEDAAQFNDPFSARFFMRVVFRATEDEKNLLPFKESFEKIAAQNDMTWSVTPEDEKVKTLLLVSKADHCLEDLLYRVRTNALPLEITAVASNHEICRKQVEARGYRFEYLPVTPATKAAQESQITKLAKETGSELIVMARYMQILSDDFCQTHAGHVINIHHSFLPGFKGARPYHQAWQRGVKIIGATAHFATADLDEGPIIEQETVRISHKMTPEKLQSIGQDIESRVLASALLAYAERRIFLQSGRTIIL